MLEGRLAAAVRNIGTNWLGMGLNIVIAFAMMPYVIEMLGSKGYGFWALLQSVISYMFVLDFGVRSGMNRYLARLYATRDHDAASRIASTGLCLYLAVGGAVILATLGLAVMFDRLFYIEILDDRTVAWSVMLVGVSVSLRFPGAVFDAVLTGVQRYDLSNYAHVAGLLVRTGLIVWALESGFGVLGIAAATFAGSVVSLVGQWWLAVLVWPGLQLRLRSARTASLRLLASHGVFAYVLLTATHVITESGTVMVGALLGSGAVAFYAIAVSLTSYATGVISGISTTITPAASNLEARGDTGGIEALCTRGTRLILLTGLPILLTFILTGDLFVRLWIGPGYEPTYRILVWLSVAWGFNYMQSAAACVLIGLSRHRVAAALVLVQAVIGVTLGATLVGPLGVEGVAIGAAVASIIMNTVFQYHALSELRVPVRRFLRGAVGPALVAVLPFAVALLGLMAWHEPATLVGYFGWVTLSVLLMAALAPWLGLTKSERDAIAAMVRRPFQHVAVVRRGLTDRR